MEAEVFYFDLKIGVINFELESFHNSNKKNAQLFSRAFRFIIKKQLSFHISFNRSTRTNKVSVAIGIINSA
ncbi:MAG: hypothetical protein RSF68_01225, partial [Myroides sp.]